jgi:transcriptional regulator with XRE-family HTH domain
MRSRIVLMAADGLSNIVIASQLRTMQHTVSKWRRYLESGLDGLLDEPRPGTWHKLSDRDVERVLTLTLESTPADATHWSTRSLAKRVGLSRNSIHRIWLGGISQIPRHDGTKRTAGTGNTPDSGQLRHSQEATNPGLASKEAALSPALHAHFGQLAQPGRTMVLSTD